MIRRRLYSHAVTCKRAGFFSAVNFSCVCERCYYYYSIQVFEKVMSVSLLRSRSTDGTTEIGGGLLFIRSDSRQAQDTLQLTRTTNFVSAKENM